MKQLFLALRATALRSYAFCVANSVLLLGFTALATIYSNNEGVNLLRLIIIFVVLCLAPIALSPFVFFALWLRGEKELRIGDSFRLASFIQGILLGIVLIVFLLIGMLALVEKMLG